jgi:hypothetical protein
LAPTVICSPISLTSGRRTPPAEQSSREFASADPSTRSAAPLHQIRDVEARTQAEYSIFHVPRHDIASAHHRELRDIAMQTWRDIARLQAA